MKLALILTLGIVSLTTGCVTTGGTGSGSTPTKAVNIDNLKSLVNKKDIYIGHLGVTFVIQDKSSSKSTSPMSRHSKGTEFAQAVLTAKLTGVPPTTLQAITDQAYANLVKDLQARGYNVKTYDDLKKNKRWSKITGLETPYSPTIVMGNFLRSEDRKTVTYAPTGMALLYGESIPNPHDLSVIADETKTPVLAVNYTVHFAYFDKEADYTVDYFKNVPKGGGASQTLSASVALGQGIQVIAGSGLVFLVDQGGTFSNNGSAKLKDPVVVLGAFGTNEDTTSGLAQASNAFSSALGLFSGGSTEHKEISVQANPDYFEYGVLKAITETNTRLSNALPAQP